MNTWLTRVGDLLIGPFADLPLLGLVLYAAVSGVAAAYVFGKTSRQNDLQRVANQARANLLAVRLFAHDPWVTLRCQLRLLRSALLRIGYSLPPMLVMLIPFLAILIQLGLWYDHLPLRMGDRAVVRVDVQPHAWETLRNATLQTSSGLRAESQALRDEQNHALYWRVKVEQPQLAQLRWTIGDSVIEKQVAIGDNSLRLVRVSPRRPGAGFWDGVLHPAERGLPESTGIAGIEIQHPPRKLPVLGLSVPWWLTFLVVSMVSAWIAGRPLGVRF